MNNTKLASSLIAIVPLLTGAIAQADDGPTKDDVGRPGTLAEVERTIEVKMGDVYFAPESIDVKDGETIRFVLKNDGAMLHEFNLGKAAAHAAHQKEMAAMFRNGTLSPTGRNHDMQAMDHTMGGMKMVGMEHNAPNSTLVEPGTTQELIWTFSKTTGLQFACNVPGHYQLGMVGLVNVK
ncbi:cupredoxin domain-containing protein [Metapseudomonas boanensis]|uniref:Plastocyanin n=1 Tax=Metapseudomonas boanensis TaxID=2822138 RepID=A0ABS5XAX7_9GAMM|nr:plastocyanin/azurin family copper-binding protein [Pseudomonas boanensis]MBT8764847.1 plastocyanin [Pseudomonas boanensis]